MRFYPPGTSRARHRGHEIMRFLGYAAAVIAVATAGTAEAAVTFDSATVAVGPYAYAENPDGYDVGLPSGGSGKTTTVYPSTPLSVSDSANASVAGATASAAESVSLTLFSTTSGKIDSSSSYSSVVTDNNARALAEDVSNTTGSASYYFTITDPMRFSYSFSDIGVDTSSARFGISGPGSGVGSTPLSDGDTGSILLDMAGSYQLYFFGYLPSGGADQTGIGSRQLSFSSALSFTLLPANEPPIGAVPEPATWAMMIGGFGMVGGAIRRRKVAFATA